MMFLHGIFSALALLSSFSQTRAQQTETANLPYTLTLSYQPLLPTNAASSQLAVIAYDTSASKSSLTSWTPPTSPEDLALDTSAPLIHILSPTGSSSIVSQSVLSPKISQNIDIWLTSSNEILSVSLTTIQPPPLSKEAAERLAKEVRLRARGKEVPTSKPHTTKRKAEKSKAAKNISTMPGEEQEEGPRVRVNLHIVEDGPAPKLVSRAPAQVDEQGREIVPEEVQEKSFFQKYWFVLLIGAFLLMNTGGKE